MMGKQRELVQHQEGHSHLLEALAVTSVQRDTWLLSHWDLIAFVTSTFSQMIHLHSELFFMKLKASWGVLIYLDYWLLSYQLKK